jgi:hypothetical protein
MGWITVKCGCKAETDMQIPLHINEDMSYTEAGMERAWHECVLGKLRRFYRVIDGKKYPYSFVRSLVMCHENDGDDAYCFDEKQTP